VAPQAGVPLAIVIGFSACKDAFEDFRRHQADNQLNGSITRVLKEGTDFRETTWEHVHVGDFVQLRGKDQIPADILVLATSESDGQCFVETKNLDGETNLKTKYGLPPFAHVKEAADVAE